LPLLSVFLVDAGGWLSVQLRRSILAARFLVRLEWIAATVGGCWMTYR